jgi:hypothetical protein
LERHSYSALLNSAAAALLLLTLRLLLAWYADRRLQVRRFHFWQQLLRATSAFVTKPEIE